MSLSGKGKAQFVRLFCKVNDRMSWFSFSLFFVTDEHCLHLKSGPMHSIFLALLELWRAFLFCTRWKNIKTRELLFPFKDHCFLSGAETEADSLARHRHCCDCSPFYIYSLLVDCQETSSVIFAKH